MLKNERHEIIIDLIHQQHSVRVGELKRLFEVSDETVRRDLADLEKKGLLRCVHGGAVYDSPTTNEYHIEMRIKKNRQEKEAICAEAAKMVRDGESIAIVGSTTTWPLGQKLVQKNNLTVVTNSILLANQIGKNRSNQVILTGGVLWPDDQKLMGSLTEADFLKFNVDKVLFSAAGVSVENGISDYNETETELTKTVLQTSHRAIFLNDYTKFNVMAFRKVADIHAVQTIVTDWNASSGELKVYRDLGIQVIRAQK